MLKFLAISWLLTLVVARPQDANISNDAVTYGYAVDLTLPANSTHIACLKTSRYNAVFVRGYSADGFDVNSISTIRNAYQAGLAVEVYMIPNPKSGVQGADQLDNLINILTNNGITVRSIWIQVTMNFPNNWSSSTDQNANFVNSIVNRARQRGLTVGIYTAQYIWKNITGDLRLSSDVLLWYWSISAFGVTGESPPNFNDFKSFNSWTAPSIKQYAQLEIVCGLGLNRDVYAVGIPAAEKSSEMMKTGDGRVIVGSIGL